MGCLKMNGVVVGGTDGPSRDLHPCYRSGTERRRLGCDGPYLKPSARDDAVVERVLQYLAGKLPENQLSAVASLLDGNLSTEDDAPSDMGVSGSEADPSSSPGGGSTRTYAPTDRTGTYGNMGTDARFPHQNRLKFGTGSTGDTWPARHVRPAQMTAEQSDDYAWRFPNADRLKA